MKLINLILAIIICFASPVSAQENIGERAVYVVAVVIIDTKVAGEQPTKTQLSYTNDIFKDTDVLLPQSLNERGWSCARRSLHNMGKSLGLGIYFYCTNGTKMFEFSLADLSNTGIIYSHYIEQYNNGTIQVSFITSVSLTPTGTLNETKIIIPTTDKNKIKT